MRRRLALGSAALVAVVAAVLATHTARVPDLEMAPTLLPGDLVLILPVAPRAGDVVALGDPLDPARWTLRRVEAIGGAVAVRGGSVRTGERPRNKRLDMGEFQGRPVILEGDHLVWLDARTTRQEHADVGVPDDAAFVMADNRDDALDSRWWGPVPLAALQGVVVARVGPATTPWRGLLGGRGEPAVVPKSSKLGPPAAPTPP